MPLLNLCMMPGGCFETKSFLLPLTEILASVQALTCLPLAASEFRTKAWAPFPAIFVCAVEDEPDRSAGQLNSLIKHVRLRHNHFNRQHIQQMILLAIVTFFRWVKHDLMLGLTYNIFVPVFFSHCCFTAECCRLIVSDGTTSYCLKNV